MDGENNGKPLLKMDALEGKNPIFGNTQLVSIGGIWTNRSLQGKNLQSHGLHRADPAKVQGQGTLPLRCLAVAKQWQYGKDP